MDRVAIQANFAVSATNDFPSSTKIKEDSNTNGFELNTEEYLLNEEITFTAFTINDRQKARDEQMIISPSPQLLVEIELLNIISRHKLPLLTFQTIFQWAIRSQQRDGFDFSDTSDRLRETALNGLKSKLGISDMAFVPRHINWLPDNKPTQC